jgi:thiopurine S-methyltransferase
MLIAPPTQTATLGAPHARRNCWRCGPIVPSRIRFGYRGDYRHTALTHFSEARTMEAEYWLQRWREGRTGWHRDAPMPLLTQHWPELAVPPGTRVLVPLCGKSLDMLWLSQQGFEVLGVDLSPLAVETFLREHRLHARTLETAGGTRHDILDPPGAAISIINGDVFGLASDELAACGAFYDRAASIALPAALRTRLAREVYGKLPPDARGLLITLDYPEGEMQGPPFSVDDAETHRLFDADWHVRQIELRDILASQPSFSENGVTALHTGVYALTRRGD